MRTGLIFLISIICPLILRSQLTIEECVDKAVANYPVIARYSLLERTQDIQLADINTSWYPRVGVYGQATLQNSVPSYPEVLSDMMTQMGQNVTGLGKFQYKGGVEVTQTIWDGGMSSARRETTRSQTAVKRASIDVELYNVRDRVENLYFAILLMEEQIARARVTHDVLISNLEKLESMRRNGTATQADCDKVEARALTLARDISSADHAVKGYRNMLSLFIGEDVTASHLVIPTVQSIPSGESLRPELTLFNSRIAANNATDRLSRIDMMPKVGAFVQAYYGYPGMNYFKSMMTRNPSFNLLAGVKISWNIDSFYTRKNTSRQLELNNLEVMNQRDVFLFNSSLQTSEISSTIEGLRDVMKEDERIIRLQENVRRAAESQLENGVIDTSALLTVIADESEAQLTAKYHEIRLIQEIYKLKYTLNK